MRKLKLDTETLRVETFPASEPLEAQRGTVRARNYTDCCGTGAGSCLQGETEGSCMHTGYPCHETHYNWYTCGVSCWYACLQTGCMPTCNS